MRKIRALAAREAIADERVLIQRSDVITRTVRNTVADLSSAQPLLAMARRQLAAIREKAAELEAELAECEASGAAAAAIVARAQSAYAAIHDVSQNSELRKAGWLARCITVAGELQSGKSPGGALDAEVEAARVMVETRGVADAALAMCAVRHPEIAVAFAADRETLDRLVIAFTVGVSGSKWTVLNAAWFRVFKHRFGKDDVKKEIAKLTK